MMNMNKFAKIIAYLNIDLSKDKTFVFLTGCGRSGTTIISDILSQSKDIAKYPGEGTELWFPKHYPLKDTNFTPFFVDPQGFSKKAIRKNTSYVKRVFSAYCHLKGKKILQNKNVMMPFILDEARELFNNMKIVHIIRDGRDVSYSYTKKTLKKGKNFNFKEEELFLQMAKLWNLTIDQMDSFFERHSLVKGKDYIEIRYEDICKEPQKEINKYQGLINADLNKEVKLLLQNRNGKYHNAYSQAILEEATMIMRENLKRKGYL
ncbi:MAG: hypothetical protein C0601_09955 [Candidatus Muiribacterium halophilum]|uniref:Sulfotransferase n=1 Tax=Muiribacterium halophilum TaxID=2053465 RepID=A0A2N5ZD55_MUIH1|nr:MAG: hypothetical protein C0601_09955 [Candidatus Muirbacterium halophilum]